MLHITTTPSVAYVVRDFPVYRSYDGMRVGWIIPTEVRLILQRVCLMRLVPKHMWLAMSRTVPTSIWDADRCIAVDENGMEVHGDYILYVCGKYLKECGRLQNNTVVATIMSNMGLFKAMKREGIEVCVTTVGDKYVNEAMVANGYVLGGEQSGHIIFSKHATTGDGILTALMLMEVILEKKQSLGTLCKGMQMYPQLLKNVKVEDKAAVTGNTRVQAEKDRISAALGEDGRILLRESGTEPVIRVMVEAQSDELCAKYVDEMVQVIREEGLAVE